MFKNIALLALLMVFFFFGCGEEVQKASDSSRQTVTKKVKKKPVSGPSDEEAGEIATEPVYTYDLKGKRDPFRSLLDIQRPVASEQKEPLTPLQRFDLQQIKLLGVIVGLDEPKAMVVAPDSKSYILKIGTKVGKNRGTVVDINSDGVFVEEIYYDFADQVKTNIKSLKLPEREGVN